MGKSKRIRAERARAIAANPERYVKSENSKKTAIITIVIVAVIAALLLASVALAVAQSTGLLLRIQTAYSSDNYSISGTMMSYLYYTQYNYMYNLYYQYFGANVSKYLDTIKSSSLSSVKTQAEQILMLCEAARTAGISLDADDIADIDETVKSIEDSAKEAGISVNAYYGNLGINISDIRSMIELSTLASKYDEIKGDELKAGVENDDEALKKFVAEHMSLFYKADYLTYTSDTKEIADTLATFKTADEFKAEIIRLTVEDKYASEFNSAASKLEAADKPVNALTAAIKATLLAELKYSLLEIKVEGLDLEGKTLREDRIKAIFEKLYSGETFAAGEGDTDKATAVAISEALYDVLATVGDKISSTAGTAVKNAEKLEQEYALEDIADQKTEEEKTETETSDDENEDKPTEAELWIFADGRKEGDSTVIKNTAAKEGEKDTYTVIVMTKPNYLDTEITKNVGHILLKVETEKASSSATAEEKAEIEAENEKAFADKEPKAKEILELIKGKTKDEFEAVAKEHNEDSNIFYDNVHTGDMVKEFEDWCFDEARKAGDTGYVKTEYGWHVMYFVGDGLEAWKASAITEYVNDAWNNWFNGLTYTVTANETTIANACS